MEVLRNLQASLANFLGPEFERAEEHLKVLLAEQDAKDNGIQEARLEERDREYSALNREFELRGAKIKELEDQLQDLDKWHERALEAETLREDNAELQRELDVLKSTSREIPEDNPHEVLLQGLQEGNPDSVIQDFSTEHGDPGTIPYASYTELAKRYRIQFCEMRNVIEAFSRLKAKHRLCKDTVKSWYKLFDKDTFTIPVQDKSVTFRRVVEDETHKSGRAQPDLTATANVQMKKPRTGLEKTKPPDTTLKHSAGEIDREDSNVHPQLAHSSSPASIAAINNSPPIKMELKDNDHEEVQEIPNSTPASTLEASNDSADDGELQEVTPTNSTTAVSKSLKRKRHPGQNEEILSMKSSDHSPNSGSMKPVTVKSEQSSSSPLRSLMQQRELNNLDTQDLDEIDDSVQTPRKKNTGSASKPISILQDEDSSNSARPTRSGHRFGEQRGEDKPCHVAALKPKDCNMSIVRRYENIGNSPKRRRGDRRGADAIPIITEDGEDDFYKGQRKRRGGSRKPRESARLNDLLEAPSSPKMALTPRLPPKSTGAKASVNSARALRDPIRNGQLPLVTPSKPPINKHPTSARQAHSTGTFGGSFRNLDHRRVSADDARFNLNADGDHQDGEPYRSRTVDRLLLDNFKINPDRNEGIDYAFDDVVRKRDQRQCLPGCTRPDCCGSRFRAMAKIGGLSVLPGTESMDEDRAILENYLGDQKYRLETMSEDEKHELLIDAKAEALSTRYGRHRYAHERHHSPPGFWRTDMPSTQELEQDREEARQLEREKVESRYREAMRPGGMWKFADE